MTEINKIDISVIYQEFKEWIINSAKNEKPGNFMLEVIKNDRKIN